MTTHLKLVKMNQNILTFLTKNAQILYHESLYLEHFLLYKSYECCFGCPAHFGYPCAFSLPSRILATPCALPLLSSALPSAFSLPCAFSLPHARFPRCLPRCLPLPSALPLKDSQNAQVRIFATLLAHFRCLPLPSAGFEQKAAEPKKG